MIPTIYKHVFKVVVLSEAETYDEDLFTIAAAITDGDDIGQCEYESVERLDDKQRVVEELVAIGNDGTFFQYDWEEEDANVA